MTDVQGGYGTFFRAMTGFLATYPVMFPSFDELSYISTSTLFLGTNPGSASLFWLSLQNIRIVLDVRNRIYGLLSLTRPTAIVAPILQSGFILFPQLKNGWSLALQENKNVDQEIKNHNYFYDPLNPHFKKFGLYDSRRAFVRSSLYCLIGSIVSLPFHLIYVRQIFKMATAKKGVLEDFYFWNCLPKSFGEVGSCIVPYVAWGFTEVWLQQLMLWKLNCGWWIYQYLSKVFALEGEYYPLDPKAPTNRLNSSRPRLSRSKHVLKSFIHSFSLFAEKSIYHIIYCLLTAPFKVTITRTLLLDEGGGAPDGAKGLLGVIGQIYSEEGVSGFYKGFLCSLLFRLANAFLWDIVANFIIDLIYGTPRLEY